MSAVTARPAAELADERAAYEHGHTYGLKAARRVVGGHMDRAEFVSACATAPALPLTAGEPVMAAGFWSGLYAGLIEARAGGRR